MNYKKASPEANAKAKAALEQALSSPDATTSFLSGTINCGPVLWNDLKANQDSLSKDSTPVTVIIPAQEPIRAEGRGFRTQEQRNRFWKAVLVRFPELQTGVVRLAKANEIQFYWETIPFDIEEPFFAIETPNSVFIANLIFEKNTPVLFSLDRVDDLRKLRK
ncbi:MAG: hypothetical protein ABR905_15530 [Terracidiphilus sp.]